ncbi:tRNA uridine-5-carboxymethylaminomethyl(34) synthesis GTPase MnmE [Stakelama saccharophila]|uniref:tRNA modification GTPase MnmE n=1 Tax=Stakelama saccharophila TaxID=3075605 RepID=A0ABZ0BCI5_9SPHN|nr:tRNA uridine-5-carboxymethylaminomethyl(34) synthesis GTPase MnmE [Stakelama sp. W311]WNO54009.1 tRNA uridine-5-carboxymethylaminomethyl(34) synthesis GTPase MnmE [Stakelama sp. W311]
MDTIFALSSGAPPAAIGVIRISGVDAAEAARRFVAPAGSLPEPRRAVLRRLYDPDTKMLLDEALLLWFRAPHSATGEDLVELHVHGGRAVVDAVQGALARQAGLRHAEPGEFTRRALMAGRMDLTQAEGLGDLLTAQTEAARVAAMGTMRGTVRHAAEAWQAALLALAARVEAVLDHADEDDVEEERELAAVRSGTADLAADMGSRLDNPPVERLQEGVRVILAGPPNSGKSTLLNRMSEQEAAIVSPIAGTTRDRIDVALRRAGKAFVFTDTAGLVDATDDPIERIGIERSKDAIGRADIIVWLGDGPPPDAAAEILKIHSRADEAGRGDAPSDRISVSAVTGQGIDALWRAIEKTAASLLPRLDVLVLNRRQRSLLEEARVALTAVAGVEDPLVLAEQLRLAMRSIDRVTGKADVEAMLDSLFSRFCIGK